MADPFLAAPIPGQAAAATPQATTDPFLAAPLPKPTPQQQGKPGGVLRTIGGILETPFSLINATLRDNAEGHAGIDQGSHLRQLLSTLGSAFVRGDSTPFADAAQEYGLGTKSQNTFMAQHGDPVANWALQHPWGNAALTAGEEFANPSNVLVGEAARPLGALLKFGNTALRNAAPAVANAQDAIANPVLNFFDRFRPLRQAGGPQAESVARQLLNNKQGANATATDAMQQIFGNSMPRDQQIALINHYQTGAGPVTPQMAQAAQLLKQTLGGLDEQQVAAGLLDPEKLWSRTPYFPTKGAWQSSQPTQAVQDFLGSMPGAGKALGTVKGTTAQAIRKQYETIADGLQNGDALRPDWLPADALLNHLRQRLGNVAFEQDVTKFGPNLLRDIPAAGASNDMVPAELLRDTSPALAGKEMDPALAEFIRDANSRTGTNNPVLNALDMVNRGTRAAMISNPAVHLGFNVPNNYAAGGGTLGNLLASATGKLDPEMQQMAEEYAAHSNMAPNSFLGGDYGKISTLPYNELTATEKADKALSGVWNANQNLVFNKGEKVFADALFASKIQAGATPEEAGIAVRKALGDYANVTSGEAGLNHAMFFYPWLKTNASLWSKGLVDSPQLVNAPMQGIDRLNEANGDPNYQQSSPFTAYMGKTPDGQNRYWSVPLPQRILGDLTDTVFGKDLTTRAKAVDKMAENHLSTVLNVPVSGIHTLLEDAKEPGGANYRTLWDKDAPASVQAEQLIQALGTKALPPAVPGAAPFAQSLVGNKDPGALLGLVGGATFTRPDPGKEKAASALQRKLNIAISTLRKQGNDKAADALYRSLTPKIQKLNGTK